jgi:multiple sugar transport system permease protein
VYLFGGSELLDAWLVTVVFVCSSTALTTFLGLTWALILTQGFPGHRALRTASLAPWVLPNIVAAFLAAWLLNGNFGLLNSALMEMGVISAPRAWLTTDAGAMIAVILTKTWLSVPVAMIFFLASLQNLPNEQLEAAKLDGASDWQLIRHVITPFLRGTIIIVLLLQAIGNLQHADIILALTGGGPVRATSVLAVEVYRYAFQSVDYGLAATTGVVWFFTIAVPAVVYVRQMFKE